MQHLIGICLLLDVRWWDAEVKSKESFLCASFCCYRLRKSDFDCIGPRKFKDTVNVILNLCIFQSNFILNFLSISVINYIIYSCYYYALFLTLSSGGRMAVKPLFPSSCLASLAKILSACSSFSSRIAKPSGALKIFVTCLLHNISNSFCFFPLSSGPLHFIFTLVMVVAFDREI